MRIIIYKRSKILQFLEIEANNRFLNDYTEIRTYRPYSIRTFSCSTTGIILFRDGDFNKC